MSKNTGGPAFPVQSYVNADGETFESEPQGMTLRDYFAAKAMQAILPGYVDVFDDDTASEGDTPFPELLAIDAYRMADAMLKARQK